MADEIEIEVPNYTRVQNGHELPPSYESLFGEIKKARKNANGNGQFVKSLWKIFSNSSAANLNNCPVKTYIPLWLVVGGSCAAAHQVVSIYTLINEKFPNHDEMDYDEDTGTPVLSIFFNATIICFEIAWFLAGCVWVFGSYPPNTKDPTLLKTYCDHNTYYLAFSLITIVFSVGICVGSACLCCLFFCIDVLD